MKTNTGTDTMTSEASTSSEKSGSKAKGRVISIRQNAIPNKVELWHSVYVVGPEKGFNFAQMFARAKCTHAETLQDADIVVFTGGSVDVHPALYGVDAQDTHESVFFESQECIDVMNEYIEAFYQAYYQGIPMVGICLGAQFLHVMNGGKLYQDLDYHNSGSHPMYCHETGRTLKEISSVHHQSCQQQESMIVLGSSCESSTRWIDRSHCESALTTEDDEDIEAFFYPMSVCLGIQGHPEYQGFPEYTEWCLNLIQEHIINNKNLALQDNQLRTKEEFNIKQSEGFNVPDTIHSFVKEYT